MQDLAAARSIGVYRALARQTDQPLHLGLTEAGMGTKGLVWSASAMGVLLAEGIGDTIRVSLTPRPGGDRREEVYAACELLQALGLRSFSPSVTACPGCGRTTSSTFQELTNVAPAFKLLELASFVPVAVTLSVSVVVMSAFAPSEASVRAGDRCGSDRIERRQHRDRQILGQLFGDLRERHAVQRQDVQVEDVGGGIGFLVADR